MTKDYRDFPMVINGEFVGNTVPRYRENEPEASTSATDSLPPSMEVDEQQPPQLCARPFIVKADQTGRAKGQTFSFFRAGLCRIHVRTPYPTREIAEDREGSHTRPVFVYVPLDLSSNTRRGEGHRKPRYPKNRSTEAIGTITLWREHARTAMLSH
jgi:hypothetical protein